MSDRVSVLLPARNAESTILHAIKSTLAALRKNDELLVFDDGSTDSTPRILEDYPDDRVKVTYRPSSVGVANALNALLGQAKNPYIARMDADDICLPGRFRFQGRYLQSRNLDVAFGNVIHFGSRMLPRPSRMKSISPRLLAICLLVSNPVAHSAMFAKRSAVESVGLYRPAPAEDYDLWLRLTLGGARIGRSAAPVILYRHHASQITHTSDWQEARDKDPLLLDSRAALAARVAPAWASEEERRAGILVMSKLRGAPLAVAQQQAFGSLSRAESTYVQARVRAEARRLGR